MRHLTDKFSSAHFLNLCTAWLILGLCISAEAAPDLQKVTSIGGVTIFSDHQGKNKFYYLKGNKRLMNNGEVPDFHYYVNRYVGTEQTGDASAFWVRGAIKFRVTSTFANTDYQQLRNQIKSQFGLSKGSPITLQAAPVKDSYNRLVYATIENKDDNDFHGVLEGGHSVSSFAEDEANDGIAKGRLFGSTEQRFTIGLSGNDANLFWQNFERENLSLSLAYGWHVKGVVLDQNDQWIDSSYEVNNALPINISPKEFPQLFTKNELWQQVRFAHSNLTIMCYDFINLDETDLYYVNVEVRFKTLRDQNYLEQVKFVADDDQYEKAISFQLANDIKDGYEYRVRRLTTEGEMTESEWQHMETAWLDVSLSGAQLTAQEVSSDEDQSL